MADLKPPTKLPYRQLQALETKRRIARAARKLFATLGYAGTTMEAIAEETGVVVRTVYAAFGTKKAILGAVCDEWLAEADVRSLMGQAMAEKDVQRKIALLAELDRQQWERGPDVIAVLQSAATTNADVARMLKGWIQQRNEILAQVVDGMAGSLKQGLDPTTATAILRALGSAEVYHELVVECGWSPDRYQEWLTGTLNQQLLGGSS
jgi:AcrR family transcriptional regulator